MKLKGYVEEALKNQLKSFKTLLPWTICRILLAKWGDWWTNGGKSFDGPTGHKLKKPLQFPFYCEWVSPIEKGFCNGGGVHLKEVNWKLLQSKLTQGLYFCGEL